MFGIAGNLPLGQAHLISLSFFLSGSVRNLGFAAEPRKSCGEHPDWELGFWELCPGGGSSPRLMGWEGCKEQSKNQQSIFQRNSVWFLESKASSARAGTAGGSGLAAELQIPMQTVNGEGIKYLFK